MKNDDLILDILEKLHDKAESIAKDVQDIKLQQVIHDEIVKTHEKRSMAAEENLKLIKNEMNHRFEKLEDKAQFVRHLIIIIVALGGIVTFVLKAVSVLSH